MMPRAPKAAKVAMLATAVACAALPVALVLADFSAGEWRYVKSVTLPADLGERGLVEVAPDAEVFAGSAAGLVDLRVVSGDGVEVPYKMEVSRGELRRTAIPATLMEKGYVPGQYTTFVADLRREGVLHNQIEIRTPSSNFNRTALVESSDDGGTWTEIAEQQIYDFTVEERGFSARDTRINYPYTSARYLRVRVIDEGQGPIEVAGASVSSVKETPPREVRWPSSLLSTTRDAEDRTTLVELDLGFEGVPSKRISIEVTDVNFHREVGVEHSEDRIEWRTLASRGAIYAFDTPRFVGSSLYVSYPETASRYLRLVIRDEDNPPLDVQEVEVWGLQRRLVFSADPGQSYSLYYGNPDAGRPIYDIEHVLPYLDTEDLAQADLGPQQENLGFLPEQPAPLPVTERMPWLLGVVVAVAAVVVGFILLGVLRRARKVLPPPAE